MNIGFTNTGDKIAHHVQAKLMIPFSALVQPRPPALDLNGELYQSWELDMAWSDSPGPFMKRQKNTDPLLPKLGREITTVKLLATDQKLPDSSIYYAVYADEAPVFRGKLLLSDIPAAVLSEISGMVRKIEEPP